MIAWEKVATTLIGPTPIAILRMLDVEGELSPTEMASRLNLPVGQTSYHVRRLAEVKLIVLVRTEPRRGALEHFYTLSNRKRNGNGSA